MAEGSPKFNLRNPAVKRIMQEIKEIKQDTAGDLLAEALETDIFEWHFVIRGPPDTEFEGGIYHGRILLPADYPFKPPSFMMLTPNGRFETNMKICLSISSHHPEHWQPSWSVRTALTALIAFMPSPGAGALGALDFPKEERRVLAARSRQEPPRFGSADRQRVIDDMHSRMLALTAAKEADAERRRSVDAGVGASAPQNSGGSDASARGEEATGGEQQQQESGSDGSSEGEAPDSASAEVVTSELGAAPGALDASPGSVTAPGAAAEGSGMEKTNNSSNSSDPRVGSFGALPAVTATTADGPHPHKAQSEVGPAPATGAASSASRAAATAAPLPRLAAGAPQSGAAAGNAAAAVTSTDHMLTALMWALYVGIGAILLRKVMGVIGFDISELLQ